VRLEDDEGSYEVRKQELQLIGRPGPSSRRTLTLRLIVHGAPRRLCQSGTGRRFMTLNLVERSFQPPPAVGDDARRAQREPHAARTKRSAESTWTKLKRCPAR
jgi:hypothetical protein